MTNETGHTPGPWALIAHDGSLHICTDSARSWPIADVDVSADGVLAEEQANARLIASAPELLGALCRAWDVLATGQPFASGSALDGEIHAAIAKATDQQTTPAPWAVEGPDNA